MNIVFTNLQKDMFRKFLRQADTAGKISDLLDEADAGKEGLPISDLRFADCINCKSQIDSRESAPMSSVSREIVVSNSLGLHARPAMQFVDLANQFKSDIRVVKGGEEPAEADGKSVMQMIILAATEGTPLRIEATGEDAEAAVTKLAELFASKFGEE
jgi:phosphocarrier protein